LEQLEGRTLLALLSGPAAINYPVGSTMHENVFVLDHDDDTLRLDKWNGASWSWADLGKPAAGVASAPAVINYPVAGPMPHENVFVRGGDGHLYLDLWNGTKWSWHNLGTPAPGVLLSENSPAVINYQVKGGALHENVFVTGTNGELYADCRNGTKWKWTDCGSPSAGVGAASAPAVTNYQVTGGALKENVFMTGTDGALYLCQWNGSKWSWRDQGQPSVPIGSGPAVMNYQVTGGALQENVFVAGTDGMLYDDHWNGASWSWGTLGIPAVGVTISDIATPAVGNYQPTGALRQNVFVTGSNGTLYVDSWHGSSWTWSGLRAPAVGVTVYAIPAAVVTYQVSRGTLYDHVFVIGSSPTPGAEDLYLDDWNGVSWTWADQGSP
jgi:hypothetical protein